MRDADFNNYICTASGDYKITTRTHNSFDYSPGAVRMVKFNRNYGALEAIGIRLIYI